jgi:hypothetical protein
MHFYCVFGETIGVLGHCGDIQIEGFLACFAFITISRKIGEK